MQAVRDAADIIAAPGHGFPRDRDRLVANGPKS